MTGYIDAFDDARQHRAASRPVPPEGRSEADRECALYARALHEAASGGVVLPRGVYEALAAASAAFEAVVPSGDALGSHEAHRAAVAAAAAVRAAYDASDRIAALAARSDAPTPEAECPCEGTGYIEVGTYQRARVICEEHFVPGDPNATGPAPIPATEGCREDREWATSPEALHKALRMIEMGGGVSGRCPLTKNRCRTIIEELLDRPASPSSGTVQPDPERPTADLATKTIVLRYASDGAAFTLGDWTLIAPPGTTPEQADALLAAALGSEGEDER